MAAAQGLLCMALVNYLVTIAAFFLSARLHLRF